jgi:hypothetical protein
MNPGYARGAGGTSESRPLAFWVRNFSRGLMVRLRGQRLPASPDSGRSRRTRRAADTRSAVQIRTLYGRQPFPQTSQIRRTIHEHDSEFCVSSGNAPELTHSLVYLAADATSFQASARIWIRSANASF